MDSEILKIFANSSEEKHFALNTYSEVPRNKTDLTITSGQNANWTYANFFVQNDYDKINSFKINEGQYVIKKNNNEWCLYDFEHKLRASGLAEIEAFVNNVVTVHREQQNMLSTLLGLSNTDSELPDLPLQQIIFGAPGTGKSFSVDRDTHGYNVIRTTFHPDSDYSTFVGTYKPIMVEKPVMTTIGTKRVQVEDVNGKPVTESQIEYKFVPQAFAQAYVQAWQDVEQAVFLIIEEINRGNCAQIFGDIFQLLDRRQSGYSAYYITPDKDLQQYLCQVFDEEGIDERAFPVIRTGEKMCLPPNLYIWATMNTSDQSLFPIDSAFKRRWEWKYIKIKDEHKNWVIEANGSQFDWWNFLEWVNGKIDDATSSEDKKLGYFFAKANKDGVISAATFVSKVIFYLTNDVFKDYDTDIFNVNDCTLTFQDFFDEEGEIDEEVVEEFLTANGIE